MIPVFNGQRVLAELLSRLQPVLDELTGCYEVIMVNDGSRDESWRVIQELARKYSFVRGINLMRNYGQHNALLAGIRSAQHDVIVTMDDDLQHPPEEIPQLLARLNAGCDVVYGAPRKEQHGLWRDIASQVTKLALQASMGVEVARHITAFRAFRTCVRDAFANYSGPFVSIDVLLTWGTAGFAVVPVHHGLRKAGVSNYTFRKLVVHAINMITGFSPLPLQLASLMGFGFTLFGIAVLVYVLGRYFIEGGSVAGFPFLASIIAIFSGAQMFAIGIIGEYLARMYQRTMDRPTYVVRSVVDGDSRL